MKTEVVLRVRGHKVKRTVNAPNPSNAGAIAMLNLPPYIDRLHEVQIISCIGHCGFKAKSTDGQTGNFPLL